MKIQVMSNNEFSSHDIHIEKKKSGLRVMQNFNTISRYGFRPHFWILPFLSQNLIKRIYSIDTFSN
ncbi:hypothetical protein BpHYR1_037113 [Brachionus plicatilis]|uniref:Uncharacterized protein n=1 Tax=Brachionus plicatilis TaxID=10195 RepID=A0A3M7ST72_BRAPC|nr:hypothetical protein BpHYR1_037113 [Brachionus plicatilis]